MADIQHASDIGKSTNEKTLLYGPAGSGKTTYITTFPRPILFFDFDKRHQTYQGMKDVDFLVYKEGTKRAEAYREFKTDLRKYASGSKYATIAFDSTSTLFQLMKTDILGVGGTGSGATEGLTLAQWGTVTERFETFFETIGDYDTRVIVTSHDQTFQDELTGELKRVVMMIGKKLPQRVPIWFDEIYRCYREEGRKDKPAQYLIQTQSDRRWIARSSLNVRDENDRVVPILNTTEIQDYAIIKQKIEEAHKDPLAYAKEAKEERSA